MVKLTVIFDEELDRRMARLKKMYGTKAALIRIAVIDFLEKNEKDEDKRQDAGKVDAQIGSVRG